MQKTAIILKSKKSPEGLPKKSLKEEIMKMKQEGWEVTKLGF